MKKLFGKIKNNRGMTLVELIVSLAIMSIVLGCCAAIILPASRNIRYNNRMADAKILSKTIENAVSAKIKYAEAADITEINPKESFDGAKYHIRAQSDGVIYIKAASDSTWTPLVSKEFYKQFDVIVSFSTAGSGDVLVVNYEIKDQQKTGIDYKTRSVIRLLNAESGDVKSDVTNPDKKAQCITFR